MNKYNKEFKWNIKGLYGENNKGEIAIFQPNELELKKKKDLSLEDIGKIKEFFTRKVKII